MKLADAVTTIHELFTQDVADAGANADSVKLPTPEKASQLAKQAGYEDPAMAAKVAAFLAQGEASRTRAPTIAEIGEAFMALLMEGADEEPGLQKLKKRGGDAFLRAQLSAANELTSKAFLDTDDKAWDLPFCYDIQLPELAGNMKGWIAAALEKSGGDDVGRVLKKMVDLEELEGWAAALVYEWLRSPAGKKNHAPTEAEIAELLLDPAIYKRLQKQSKKGPWDIFRAQARLVAGQENHERFGSALADLESAPNLADVINDSLLDEV